MTAWTSNHFTLEAVGKGIYAALAREDGAAMGNGGFVDLGDRIIVFDTFNAPQAAQDLKEAAIHFTGHTEFIVVNSHWHGDHIRGNQVFEAAPVLSTPVTKEWIEREHPGRIRKQQSMLPQLDEDILELARKLEQDTLSDAERAALRNQLSFLKEMRIALPELRLVSPTDVIEDERIIEGTDRRVRLFSCGSGHSSSDLAMEVLDEGVLFAGDLVSIDNHPMLDGGDPQNWVKILNCLEADNYSQVIPGHGPVGDSRSIAVMRRYIEDLFKQAEHVDELDEIPQSYQSWKADFLYKSNLNYIRTRTTL
ncbi:MBL fold metallo-hydrolase [Gorillibacterium timonense]|uniref:MBL fold metallo-hydrolase n=1 Tax=Gorillibacterium timonense TaxID=1689269 RepID=UPI00071D6100|nr:MBL fold metallo-hydrolase [Gorillibacterium timonense]